MSVQLCLDSVKVKAALPKQVQRLGGFGPI